jgi:cell division protein FtsW
MARTLKSDRTLFVVTVLLVAVSVVMVYSASAVQAQARFQNGEHFLLKQIAWAGLGLGALLMVMHVDYHEYRRPALIWSLVGIVFVALLAVFLFKPTNGTQRWIAIGPASVQPSELAKLTAILFAAALLERRMHRVNDVPYAVGPIAAVTLMLAGLILREPDFGTAIVLVLVVATVLFAAGLSYRNLALSLLILLPPAIVLVVFWRYRLQRLLTFLNPWVDRLGYGFQTVQSLIAVGSGGWFGKGLMAGVQKLFYIPEPHTDFIFAVIGEELGLIGTTLTLLCFVVIGWRGLRAAVLAPDRFGALLALGLTTMVTLQALVNVSVVIALLPTKGIPLPLVSNGGSSLLINLVGMGILLNISAQGRRQGATNRAHVDRRGRYWGPPDPGTGGRPGASRRTT